MNYLTVICLLLTLTINEMYNPILSEYYEFKDSNESILELEDETNEEFYIFLKSEEVKIKEIENNEDFVIYLIEDAVYIFWDLLDMDGGFCTNFEDIDDYRDPLLEDIDGIRFFWNEEEKRIRYEVLNPLATKERFPKRKWLEDYGRISDKVYETPNGEILLKDVYNESFYIFDSFEDYLEFDEFKNSHILRYLNKDGFNLPNNIDKYIDVLLNDFSIEELDFTRESIFLLDDELEKHDINDEFVFKYLLPLTVYFNQTFLTESNQGNLKMKLEYDNKSWNPVLSVMGEEIDYLEKIHEKLNQCVNKQNSMSLIVIYEVEKARIIGE